MRLKITFKVLDFRPHIPYSYQYELSSWLYKLIRKIDPEFGQFLHTKGYEYKNSKFKMFNFSNLHIPHRKANDTNIQILSKEITMWVSCLSTKLASVLIQGLLVPQIYTIGNQEMQVRLKVVNIETKPITITSEKVRLRTLSPIFVQDEIGQYLSPVNEGYESIFIQNLQDKYMVAREQGWFLEDATSQPISFKLLTKTPKKNGILIKANKNGQTHKIGYKYSFELKAPEAIIKTGLLAGFGGQNAQGFGFCEILN